jgi:hypothetical protein
MSQARTYVNGYTVLLFVYGFVLVLAAIVLHSVAAREGEPASALRFVRNIEAVLAVACLAVAVLRSLGSPVGAPATAAISIVLSISFPFGTAAFVWWLVRIRKQEMPAPPGPS